MSYRWESYTSYGYKFVVVIYSIVTLDGPLYVFDRRPNKIVSKVRTLYTIHYVYRGAPIVTVTGVVEC